MKRAQAQPSIAQPQIAVSECSHCVSGCWRSSKLILVFLAERSAGRRSRGPITDLVRPRNDHDVRIVGPNVQGSWKSSNAPCARGSRLPITTAKARSCLSTRRWETSPAFLNHGGQVTPVNPQ